MLKMTKGERRIITADVSMNTDTFTISNYSYNLLYKGQSEITGTPTLDGHTLYTYIEPTHTGIYVFEFSFDLGNGEHIIRSTTVDVSSVRV